MRILLTGLPATGKTTLAQALAAQLGINIVREAAIDLWAAGMEVGPKMSPQSLAAIAGLQLSRELEAGDEFVADRGPIDMIAYTSLLEESAISEIVSKSVTHIAQQWLVTAAYDIVIYLSEPVGDRGNRLSHHEPEYLRRLKESFERVINDRGIVPLQIPGSAAAEERLTVVLEQIRNLHPGGSGIRSRHGCSASRILNSRCRETESS